jgi:hypothetical protein
MVALPPSRRVLGRSPCVTVRALTECHPNAITERDVRTGRGLLIVERVVDRVPGAVSAFCAFWAFGCAISAGSALWAGWRGHGKEKVYGSIP